MPTEMTIAASRTVHKVNLITWFCNSILCSFSLVYTQKLIPSALMTSSLVPTRPLITAWQPESTSFRWSLINRGVHAWETCPLPGCSLYFPHQVHIPPMGDKTNHSSRRPASNASNSPHAVQVVLQGVWEVIVDH